MLGEHGGQQVGSSRKVAGESGNKAERGQGAGERKEPPRGLRRHGELGARWLEPRGTKDDSRSYPVKDALWGWKAGPLTLAFPMLDGAGE